MSKMFKISKCGKYIKSKYLNYKPANDVIDIHNWGSMLHKDRVAFEKYRDKIINLEKLVQEKLDELELPHLNTKIIRFYLKFIESVSDGLDIRSSWSNEKIAERLVYDFDKRYNNAKANCEAHLKNLKEHPRKEYSRWREDEKYERDNDMFELGMEPLKLYYSGNPLDEAIKKTNDLLKKIKEGKANNNL